MGACQYVYSYGDYSMTQGVLATVTCTFGDLGSVNNIGFGCGEDNEGDGFEQPSELVGLGCDPLSLVSQLKEPKFSYCLTPMVMDDTKTSVLLLGSLASVNGTQEAITTPLLKNPSQPSQVEIPKSILNFKGGDLELPSENYMIGDAKLGVACLAMEASSDMSISGNVQQQNILVDHDLEKETISFVPTACDQL